MKHTRLLIVAITVGCGTQPPPSRTAAGEVAVLPTTMPSRASVDDAYADARRSLRGRVETLRLYVLSINARLPTAALSAGVRPLRATSRVIPPDAFADVTDEHWSRIDAFYDGPMLKRIRLLPPSGTPPRTEEFYYDDGKLVYVFIEPNGATKRDPHVQVDGDAFYFGKEGLIAWVKPGGESADPTSVEFKVWSAKLLAEANKFPREARLP